MIKNYKLAETWHLLEGRYVELFKIICISIIGSAVMSLICIAPLVGLFLFIFVINPVFMGCILLLIKHLLSADADIGIKSEHISKAINDSCSDCKRLIISTLFPFYKLTLFSLFFCFFLYVRFCGICSHSSDISFNGCYGNISHTDYHRMYFYLLFYDFGFYQHFDLCKANISHCWQ